MNLNLRIKSYQKISRCISFWHARRHLRGICNSGQNLINIFAEGLYARLQYYLASDRYGHSQVGAAGEFFLSNVYENHYLAEKTY